MALVTDARRALGEVSVLAATRRPDGTSCAALARDARVWLAVGAGPGQWECVELLACDTPALVRALDYLRSAAPPRAGGA